MLHNIRRIMANTVVKIFLKILLPTIYNNNAYQLAIISYQHIFMKASTKHIFEPARTRDARKSNYFCYGGAEIRLCDVK